MKIKQYVVITNPEAFLRGNFYSCFDIYDRNPEIPGWIGCGEIEFEIEVDSAEVVKITTDAINEEIAKEQAKLEILERRKAELLFITHDGDTTC